MSDILSGCMFLLWLFGYMFICCIIGYILYERGEGE